MPVPTALSVCFRACADAYMAVSNLRWPQPTTHARLLASFGFAAIAAAARVRVHPDRPELGHVNIRVGLHSGPVVASVVGTLNRRYCLFGKPMQAGCSRPARRRKLKWDGSFEPTMHQTLKECSAALIALYVCAAMHACVQATRSTRRPAWSPTARLTRCTAAARLRPRCASSAGARCWRAEASSASKERGEAALPASQPASAFYCPPNPPPPTHTHYHHHHQHMHVKACCLRSSNVNLPACLRAHTAEASLQGTRFSPALQRSGSCSSSEHAPSRHCQRITLCAVDACVVPACCRPMETFWVHELHEERE